MHIYHNYTAQKSFSLRPITRECTQKCAKHINHRINNLWNANISTCMHTRCHTRTQARTRRHKHTHAHTQVNKHTLFSNRHLITFLRRRPLTSDKTARAVNNGPLNLPDTSGTSASPPPPLPPSLHLSVSLSLAGYYCQGQGWEWLEEGPAHPCSAALVRDKSERVFNRALRREGRAGERKHGHTSSVLTAQNLTEVTSVSKK